MVLLLSFVAPFDLDLPDKQILANLSHFPQDEKKAKPMGRQGLGNMAESVGLLACASNAGKWWGGDQKHRPNPTFGGFLTCPIGMIFGRDEHRKPMLRNLQNWLLIW
jgi:hypothetical protein